MASPTIGINAKYVPYNNKGIDNTKILIPVIKTSDHSRDISLKSSLSFMPVKISKIYAVNINKAPINSPYNQ